MIVISADAEKSIWWKNDLFVVLKAFGLGETLNYCTQVGVRTTDIRPENFPLERGTCHGGPVSPSAQLQSF